MRSIVLGLLKAWQEMLGAGVKRIQSADMAVS